MKLLKMFSYFKLFVHSLMLMVTFYLCNLNLFAEKQLPSREEMWEIIQEQKLELQTLSEMLEQVAEGEGGKSGLSWANKTSIGGYGELHYNNLTDQHGSSDKREIDFHRFVLYVGHEFSDRIRFFSEAELEHSLAGEGKEGEVELEQAYVDIDVVEESDQTLTLRGGLFLMPVGILNETHEPPTFYGVERNIIEGAIIPTTWWEAGLGIYGDLVPGLSYDLAFTSGLNVPTNYSIRSGRQKVSEAAANDPAYTARLKWNVPGVEIAGTFQYQSDLTQNTDKFVSDTTDSAFNPNFKSSSATLIEFHTILEQGPFGLRALYARWDLSGSGAERAGRDEQYGWFVEPSFKINEYFGVFARYSWLDNTAGDSTRSEVRQSTAGITWWPHENVVFKLDFQDQNVSNGKTERDGFNLGFGYNF